MFFIRYYQFLYYKYIRDPCDKFLNILVLAERSAVDETDIYRKGRKAATTTISSCPDQLQFV